MSYFNAIDNIINKQNNIYKYNYNFDKCIELLQDKKIGDWIWWIFPNTVYSMQDDDKYSLTNEDLFNLAKLEEPNAQELFKKLIIISSVVLENYITNKKNINTIMNSETDTYKFLNSIFLFYLLYKHTDNKIYLLYKYIFELIYSTAQLNDSYDKPMFNLIGRFDTSTYNKYKQKIPNNIRTETPSDKRFSDFIGVKNQNNTLLRLENFCQAYPEYNINTYYNYAVELSLGKSQFIDYKFIKLNHSNIKIQYLNCMFYKGNQILYYNYNNAKIIYNCTKSNNSKCLIRNKICIKKNTDKPNFFTEVKWKSNYKILECYVCL